MTGQRSSEWTEVTTTAALPGVDFTRARYRRQAFPMHAHPEFQIALVRDGAEAFRFKRRTFVAPRGSLILLRPFEAHTGEAVAEGWAYSVLFPPPSLFDEAFEGVANASQRLVFREPVFTDAIASALLLALEARVRRRDCPLAIQSAFTELSGRLAAAHTRMPLNAAQRHQAGIRKARHRLDESFAEAITLGELARIADLPPLTLLRRFREEIGCTPHVYRTTRRLAHAKKALRAGRSPAEVATEAGFADQPHLTRVMHRWSGLTPAAQARV